MRQLYQDGESYHRRRSVENVIEELRWAKKIFNIKKVCFFDDLFISDNRWLEEFSKEYRRHIELPFVCAVHPENVSKESLSLLDKAGCSAVGLGIQTTNPLSRKEILHRYESNEQIKSAIELFKSTRILLYVDILIGLPKQDENELIDVARFLNRHRPDMALPIWLKYYPRLKILEIGKEKGALDSEDINKIEQSQEGALFRGMAYNKKLGKLSSLIMISPVLPHWLNEVIITKKIYDYFFPLSTFIYLRMILTVISLSKRIFSGKRSFIFSPLNQVRYILFFIDKKISLSAIS
jgi:radical SAM superfamily enzyme YgiQ (UPF0313 family)